MGFRISLLLHLLDFVCNIKWFSFSISIFSRSYDIIDSIALIEIVQDGRLSIYEYYLLFIIIYVSVLFLFRIKNKKTNIANCRGSHARLHAVT